MIKAPLSCGDSQCGVCYACQKGDSGGQGEIYLITTEKCNLGCKYCYEKQYSHYCSNSQIFEDNKILSNEILVEKALLIAKTLGIYSIAFFGGEPLLNWQLIEDTVLTYKKQNRIEKVKWNRNKI